MNEGGKKREGRVRESQSEVEGEVRREGSS